MSTTGKVNRTSGKAKARLGRKLAERAPQTRDRLWQVAGIGYDAIPGKDARKARAVEVADRTWSKREAGERSSPLSRACEAVYCAAEEARSLEEAGLVSAFIDATLKSIAMWPALQKLTTPELVALKRATYQAETEIQGRLDVMQMKRSLGQRVDVAEERAAWTEQAALSERMMALLDLLAERPDYV